MKIYAELAAATNYSFLHGASHPHEMVAEALRLGHSGIGIADRNTVAGVVRAWSALREAQESAAEAGFDALNFKLVTGARLVFADGTPDIIAYPATRHGWGRLTRLLTLGNRRADKGGCILRLDDLLDHIDDLLLIIMPGRYEPDVLNLLRQAAFGRVWLGAVMNRNGYDRRRLQFCLGYARAALLPTIAINDALYATPSQRPLHDILTCIREKCTIHSAGRLLTGNAERHLKTGTEMARLFADAPHTVDETRKLLKRIRFDLKDLQYVYPNEPVPPGYTPQGWLEMLTLTKAQERWPQGIPSQLRSLLDEELAIIERQNYAAYFLTVYDIVAFAHGEGILCQGRGSAANSAICFVLGITAVDPLKNNLLFSRFISEERREPPDIDVDFEHERREEVIQYIYRRYGRERAGIAATVIHYRPRSAVREAGKALGLTEDVTTRLTSTVWGSFADNMERERFAETGFDPSSPEIARLGHFVGQILKFPRHLSQHVGGFVIARGRLDELVPIENASMPERTVIQWDKDDLDALGLLKVDVLGLGMLSAIRRAFDLVNEFGGPNTARGRLDLATVPGEDPAVYDMICRADTVGVFQIESRAQMAMLPRLRPRNYYDLVIEVAIVRPGPIQGEMVHPYLRRRSGEEPVTYPSTEVEDVLKRTLGVPIFQEQVMQLAIVAADFSAGEADGLRRAMAAWKRKGGLEPFQKQLIAGMAKNGYPSSFAHQIFSQILGFGEYGFPESHAASFALLVYSSSWLKHHEPAAFCAALVNSQPMGFYAPAQLVRDARAHGVEVRPVAIAISDWDCTLERRDDGRPALRLGLRLVKHLSQDGAQRLLVARGTRAFVDIADLAERAALDRRDLEALAAADALAGMAGHRHRAVWQVGGVERPLPLLPAETAVDEGVPMLRAPREGQDIVADYGSLGLSLRRHPVALLRESLQERGVTPNQELWDQPDGLLVTAAGLVITRQRPGSAGGVTFVTLEDETGYVNLIVWERVAKAQRAALLESRMLLVRGRLQREGDVLHVIAHRLTNLSELLGELVVTSRNFH